MPPLFGGTAPAAGAAGAAAPPVFGAAPAPAAGGLFGAASTPASAAPAAGGLFGAAAAPASAAPAAGGLFGAAAAPVAAAPAAGGLFGAAAAPASSAPAAGGLFGATAAPAAAAPAAGGLFGAAATPASAAPAAGGLFGGAAPAAAAPAAGGLFGAAAPAATPSLFGGGPAAAPAPSGGGLFGAAPPAAAGGGVFGAPAPAASPFGTQQLSQCEADAAKVARAYAADANNEDYTRRFQHLMLDVGPDPKTPAEIAALKPAGFDEGRWRAAADAIDILYREMSAEVGPDHCLAIRNLRPVAVNGLEGLKERVAKQDTTLAEQRKFAEGAERVLAEEQGRAVGQLQLRAHNARQVHVEQRHKLVCLQHRLEALYEAPLSLPYVNDEERALLARIEALQRDVPAGARKGGLALRLEELSASAAMRAGVANGAAGAAGAAGPRLDDASSEQLMSVLAQQTEALQRLNRAMHDAKRDLGVLEAEAAKAATKARAV